MENNQEINKKSRMESLVDTGTLVLSSLTGALPDYLSGLGWQGILASRAWGIAVNLPTAAPYGKWRNRCYQKDGITDQSSFFERWKTEFKAFNRFQTPLYLINITVGNFFQNLMNGEPKIDIDKVVVGTAIFTGLSLVSGYLTGIYMDAGRKKFDLESAGKEARKSSEGELTPQNLYKNK